MNYDIKIRGDKEDNGQIEFDRLALLTQTTKEIAIKALMLKIRGFSDIKLDSKFKQALSIRLQSLSGNESEGTIMLLDCSFFEETIKGMQLNIFHPVEEIFQLTPMSLVIQSFRSALIDDEDKDNLDKPLLKTLLKFKKNFINKDETIYFSNRSSIPEIEIRKKDVNKIEDLEENIPEPKKIIINGQLDEMKISKNKLGLLTADGVVNIFANDKSIVKGIVSFMGKDVTISGMAHFKPSGKLSYIEIHDYYEPGVKDKIFSKKPSSLDIQQQIQLQLKNGKQRNPLSSITGKWPGDESLDELLNMLDE